MGHEDLENRSDSGRRPSVCIVVTDSCDAGGHEDGLTSRCAFANTLAERGVDVTLLLTGAVPERLRRGLHSAVACESVRRPGDLFVQLPFAARFSYLTLLWLQEHPFDIVEFSAAGGRGYYTQLARRQGLACATTKIVVRLDGLGWRSFQQGERLCSDVTELDQMYMERRSIELADQLVTPDQDMLDWVAEQGWKVPDDTCVVPDPEAGETPGGPGPDRNGFVEYWLELQECAPKTPAPAMEADRRPGDPPLVSVCIVHYNRPRLLSFAIESLYQQDFAGFEVILVDDGSTEPAARQYLDRLEPDFAARGWTILRQENAYVGAARNNAARHARGDWLLFLDDDNVAAPDLVSTLVRVAGTIDADILTCATNVFEGVGAPPKDIAAGTHWVPLGGSVASGMFRNVFGDATALVRKEVFDSLGGFSEDYGLGHEDWEFFARAVLKGCRLEAVPRPLLFYRVRSGGMLLSGDTDASLVRSLRPYLEAVPPELRPVLCLALGQEHSRSAGRAGLFSPRFLVGLVRNFAGSNGRRSLARRFLTVVRTQGWSRAVKAVLRYGRQGS